jgi:hypothetical protein
VAGLEDGAFWGRGWFVFNINGGIGARLAPSVLSAALLPGGRAEIELANLGDADLLILASTVEQPFEVQSAPALIAPGQAAAIVVHYAGSGADEADLVINSNDPLRPQRRVALRGIKDESAATMLKWERADGNSTGRL